MHRFVAVGLMLCGVGVLSVVTASFASWLLERVEEIEETADGVQATQADVAELRAEVRRLRLALVGEEGAGRP